MLAAILSAHQIIIATLLWAITRHRITARGASQQVLVDVFFAGVLRAASIPTEVYLLNFPPHPGLNNAIVFMRVKLTLISHLARIKWVLEEMLHLAFRYKFAAHR